MSTASTRKCRSCGDPVDGLDDREWRLGRIGQRLAKGEGAYCEECADELFRGRISTRPARLHSAGRGGGIRDGEPSPSGENAIRHLEDTS